MSNPEFTLFVSQKAQRKLSSYVETALEEIYNFLEGTKGSGRVLVYSNKPATPVSILVEAPLDVDTIKKIRFLYSQSFKC